jgi:hypothetical protein
VLHQGVKMMTIWKLENDLWILVEEVESMEELLTTIEDLRIDGNEYRAELKTESISQILEV